MEIRLRWLIAGLFIALALVFEIRAQEGNPVQSERAPVNFIKSAHVFPNPAVDYVHVQLEDVNVTDIRFSLHNLIGNKLEVESEALNDFEFRIKVKDLAPGYYLISVKDQHSNQSGILRFLKR